MRFLFVPALLLLGGVLSLTRADEPVAPAAAEDAALQLGQETVALLSELTQVMENIKDKESADAAVAQVQTLSARMQELRRRAEALPKPDAEQERRLRESMNNAEVRAAVQRLMVAMLNLAQADAYGSEELISALNRMVSGQL